ncbi:MAG: hypothetical protein JWP08_4146, partial [Bryobacterales bacterium]|nr:hypothetical protein [Bryobacterales bacterium]
MNLRTIFGTGTLAAVLSVTNPSAALAAMPEAGQPAPSFSLPSQD